jgi:hypothetical protein
MTLARDVVPVVRAVDVVDALRGTAKTAVARAPSPKVIVDVFIVWKVLVD